MIKRKIMKDKCETGYVQACVVVLAKIKYELFTHPWNKVIGGKVNASTEMYACIARFDC